MKTNSKTNFSKCCAKKKRITIIESNCVPKNTYQYLYKLIIERTDTELNSNT